MPNVTTTSGSAQADIAHMSRFGGLIRLILLAKIATIVFTKFE